jgi:pSer/pThr/pTyr-binding forkhead associated (FHA) protein/tetratricopeptide (TPR) repeat protein
VPKLVVTRGGAIEGERPLTGESLRIGRDNQNDVVLSDPAKGVSRFHAEIRAEAGGYTVVDLKSRNGIWVNNKRVTTAALRLGTPITLGPYQLSIQEQPLTETFDTLSGDAATISPDSGRLPKPSPDASVLSRPVQPRPPVRQMPRPRETRASSGHDRYRWLWVGSAVALLVVSIVAFAIVRQRAREAPAPPSPVAAVPPAPPVSPAPDHQQEIERYLAAAKEQLANKDYDDALSSLNSALALEPADPGARSLKEEVETARSALVSPPPPRPVPPSERTAAKPPAKPPTPVEPVLVEGIPRAPGESPTDYNVRAKRVQDNYGRGKASLDKKDYHAALDSLSAVEREQPGYQDAGALLNQARTELHETARQAMDNAAKNEAAGEWYAALLWYRHAEQFESTPELVQRTRLAQDRVVKEAYIAFDRANALRKLNETAKAILQYQKVRDWLPPDDEKRQEALKQLQVLKP